MMLFNNTCCDSWCRCRMRWFACFFWMDRSRQWRTQITPQWLTLSIVFSVSPSPPQPQPRHQCLLIHLLHHQQQQQRHRHWEWRCLKCVRISEMVINIIWSAQTSESSPSQRDGASTTCATPSWCCPCTMLRLCAPSPSCWCPTQVRALLSWEIGLLSNSQSSMSLLWMLMPMPMLMLMVVHLHHQLHHQESPWWCRVRRVQCQPH